MSATTLDLQQFDHGHPQSRRLMREFVDFHWRHYADDPQYIPLLDQEYLGSRLLGMTGYFEQRHHFFANGEMTWLLARDGGEVVGRCVAFVNRLHNQRWQDHTGFVGFFESVESQEVADLLLDGAARWLRQRCSIWHVGSPSSASTSIPVNTFTCWCTVQPVHRRTRSSPSRPT